MLGLGDQFFEDVVVEFTLFTNLLLGTYYPKKSVVFLLAGNSIVVQTLYQQAKQRIGHNHRIQLLPLQDLTSDRIDAEEIDLVVTNYRPYLWEYSFNKDYLLVNTIPSENDWTRITKQLNRHLY